MVVMSSNGTPINITNTIAAQQQIQGQTQQQLQFKQQQQQQAAFLQQVGRLIQTYRINCSSFHQKEMKFGEHVFISYSRKQNCGLEK